MATEVKISELAKTLFAEYSAGVIWADVDNTKYSPELWSEIDELTAKIRTNYTVASICNPRNTQCL